MTTKNILSVHKLGFPFVDEEDVVKAFRSTIKLNKKRTTRTIVPSLVNPFLQKILGIFLTCNELL